MKFNLSVNDLMIIYSALYCYIKDKRCLMSDYSSFDDIDFSQALIDVNRAFEIQTLLFCGDCDDLPFTDVD